MPETTKRHPNVEILVGRINVDISILAPFVFINNRIFNEYVNKRPADNFFRDP